MVQDTTQKPAVEQLADDLGEGWRGKDFSSCSGDGLLYGPGGEKVYVQLYLGEAALDVALYGAEEVPTIKRRVMIGEALPCMTEAIRDIYPAWAEAWQRDRQRVAAIPGDQAAFAAAVAEHLGDGWIGGADGFWNDLTTFVARDGLRVEWRPVMHGPRGSYQMAPRLGLHPSDWRSASINIAAGRPAKAVASEIRRRLLPAAEAAREKAAVEADRHALAVAETDETATLVEGLLADLRACRMPNRDNGESQDVRFSSPEPLYLRGSMDCHGDRARLNLEGYMSRAQAQVLLPAIVKAIGEANAEAADK